MSTPPPADAPTRPEPGDVGASRTRHAHATASGHAGPGEPGAVSETAWIDLYRIEATTGRSGPGHPHTIDDLTERGVLRFCTSPALALLHHLVTAEGGASRVCLVSARVDLVQLDTLANTPPSGHPRRSVEARTPRDDDAPASRPGRLVQSTLSPADREVLWDAGHPSAGALSIVARTVFDLDPRLSALRPGAAGADTPEDDARERATFR